MVPAFTLSLKVSEFQLFHILANTRIARFKNDIQSYGCDGYLVEHFFFFREL